MGTGREFQATSARYIGSGLALQYSISSNACVWLALVSYFCKHLLDSIINMIIIHKTKAGILSHLMINVPDDLVLLTTMCEELR